MVICPCCGNETDIPILFKGIRQYILSYVWMNPNCTAREINENVYDGSATNTTISGHLCQIRRRLRAHSYALVGRRVYGTKIGARPKEYKIIKPWTKVVSEGIENAAT
jgi:predicted transcriptional regulator